MGHWPLNAAHTPGVKVLALAALAGAWGPAVLGIRITTTRGHLWPCFLGILATGLIFAHILTKAATKEHCAVVATIGVPTILLTLFAW